MKTSLPLAVVATALALVAPVVPTASAATPTTWTISTTGIGPLKLSMTMKDARKHVTLTNGSCAPDISGERGKAVALDFTGSRSTSKIAKIVVSRASTSHYRYRTASGVGIGTTVATLKAEEKGLTLSSQDVYEHGWIYYQHTSAHRWLQYVLDSDAETRKQIKPTDKVRSIEITTFKVEGGGGC